MSIRRCFDDDGDSIMEESRTGIIVTDIIAVMPETNWLIDDSHIPLLYYNTSTENPHSITSDRLILGASWTFTVNQPHWLFRRAIFEKNYFPYKRRFYYLTIDNGFIVLDGLNLCYMTDKEDSRIVYMKLSNKIRQRMVFHENGIYLTEYII